MKLKVGDLVRDNRMNYNIMPSAVRDVMTYVVVEINEKTVGVAHKNIAYGGKEIIIIWKPMTIKIENVELYGS